LRRNAVIELEAAADVAVHQKRDGVVEAAAEAAVERPAAVDFAGAVRKTAAARKRLEQPAAALPAWVKPTHEDLLSTFC
jgi:hypothetical protein